MRKVEIIIIEELNGVIYSETASILDIQITEMQNHEGVNILLELYAELNNRMDKCISSK
jgi:hypothetical protein